MRTNQNEWNKRRKEKGFKKKWKYYDEEGRGPIRRFLQTDNPEHAYPNQRIIAFFIFGAALSAVGVQLTADEYYVGPQEGTNHFVPNSEFPVHIAFQDVGCRIPGIDRTILSNVTGEIKPARLTGILGQSGSGKTTFAYQLLGKGSRYCEPDAGNVYLNGRPRNLEAFLDRVGYVPQDDVLYPDLTVEESLLFSANWRLPRSVTEQQKQTLLNETLNVLDLNHIRKQRIGDVQARGISGGEKKRVSIGMELIAQPSVLVMDEPTSGLDSAAAFQLVRTLRNIAEGGVSLVAVIHQPSTRVFELLHDIILMQEGRVAYIGPRDESLSFLRSIGYEVPSHDQCHHPPAEFLLDVLANLEKPLLGKNFAKPQAEKHEDECVQLDSNEKCSVDTFDLPVAFQEYSEQRKYWEGISKEMVKYKDLEDSMLDNVFNRNSSDGSDKLGRSSFLPWDVLAGITSKILKPYFCPEASMDGVLCPFLINAEDSLQPYFQLPKPGLKRQLSLWFWQMSVLSFRRGIFAECAVISLLAAVVALVRSYNLPWNRRPIANFLLSIVIGLIGMVGTVFNDHIGPVQRAASSGMLLGAHEFALLAHVILKGWMSCHIFSMVYFCVLYTRTGIWCCVSNNRVDYARFHTYYEFSHMLHLNYMASSGFGSVICVVCRHDPSTSHIVAVATLMSCHVFAFFTPNKNQVSNNSKVFENENFAGINIGPVVEAICAVSYARYFMEAIMLWEPDKFYDKNGRKYCMRYFGYKDSNKTWCCTNLFTLWTVAQASRFIIFGFLNSNMFHSLYDTPMLFSFICKVVCCHFLALLIMTGIQEWYFPWIASIQRRWGWKSPQSVENVVDIIG